MTQCIKEVRLLTIVCKVLGFFSVAALFQNDPIAFVDVLVEYLEKNHRLINRLTHLKSMTVKPTLISAKTFFCLLG